MARGLKTTPRTGWVLQEAGPRIESVADHSWRITLMAMVATSSGDTKYDTNKCIKMALVHDLAESTVGDITPHCGVSDDDKHKMELDAMTTMTEKLGGGGKELLDLWKEYEEGASEEAKLVKDMDKLEMILQALEYENDGKNGKSLDGFFDSTRSKWRTPLGESWGKEIEARRKAKTGDETPNDELEEKKQKI
jgi:putative hydrolase of HD superfamily